jgi:hypothetical protein
MINFILSFLIIIMQKINLEIIIKKEQKSSNLYWFHSFLSILFFYLKSWKTNSIYQIYAHLCCFTVSTSSILFKSIVKNLYISVTPSNRTVTFLSRLWQTEYFSLKVFTLVERDQFLLLVKSNVSIRCCCQYFVVHLPKLKINKGNTQNNTIELLFCRGTIINWMVSNPLCVPFEHSYHIFSADGRFDCFQATISFYYSRQSHYRPYKFHIVSTQLFCSSHPK